MSLPELKTTGRVLAVEDNPDISHLIRSALTRARIGITLLANGQTALEHLAEKSYDLVLLDYHLPGLDGIEVCRRIKADPRLQHLPVILITGQTDYSYQLEAKQAGAVEFIEKPFSVLFFIERVKKHLPPPDATPHSTATCSPN